MDIEDVVNHVNSLRLRSLCCARKNIRNQRHADASTLQDPASDTPTKNEKQRDSVPPSHTRDFHASPAPLPSAEFTPDRTETTPSRTNRTRNACLSLTHRAPANNPRVRSP